jgi:predicted kinase
MKLEVLVGMIASGKSTYARRRALEGALVVCHDDLTAMLHAEYRYEPALREAYRRMEESLTYQALLAGRDVVIDRTHLTRESRGRWLAWAMSLVARPRSVVAVAFPGGPPEEHAARRYAADPRGRPLGEWLGVARHHAEQAARDPLDWRAEGFDWCVEAKAP